MLARERLPLALLAAVIALFLIANRGAYKGYFDDDSLDNLGLSRELSVTDFTTGLLTPHFYSNNFRPVGHLFFRVLGQTAGLQFPPYIFVLHAIHLLNVCLLYLLLRRLGLEMFGASAGALLFAFHMAVFDVFWKPMYVFDLLCGCFCLASLLLYLHGRWILSLLAFWLAYRAKEVAIMLPVVLAAYELTLGKRRWPRPIPFFAISAWFGFQALLNNQHRQNDYTLRFDPAGLWKSISFYSSEIFLLPYLGLAVLLLFLLKDRRIWFGLATFCLLLVPMLLLPGRLFAAYLYVPLIGLAIAFAPIATRLNPALVALFFAVWLPWNYANLRWQRKAVLAQADLNRAYVTSLAKFSREVPPPDTFIYNGGPITPAAALGAIRVLYPARAFRFCAIDDPDARTALQSRSLAILNWDSGAQLIHPVVRTPETSDVSYIKMNPNTPVWQLENGWYEADGAFRWTQPSATARLERPAGATQFELRVNVGPVYIQTIHRSHLEVAINGARIGEHDFTQQGWQTVTWQVPPGPPGPVEVSLHVSPAFSSGRPLGLAIGGLGFVAASPEHP
jgi:hypothetical protein